MIVSSLNRSFFKKAIDPLRLFFLRNIFFRKFIFKYFKITNWGLSVFIIRKVKVSSYTINKIKDTLEQTGFNILHFKILTEKEVKSIANASGGRKWRKSKPHILIAAFDNNPIAPINSRAKVLVSFYPDLDNLKLLIKHKIRRIINNDLPLQKKGKHFHATDNSYEARQYIDALDSKLLVELGITK